MFNRFLIIISLFVFLTACGKTAPSSKTIDSKAGELDHLISFNSDGYATLRGRLSGGSQCPGEDGTPANVFIEVEMPVIVQGFESYVAVPFRVEMETKITSSITPAARAQDFFATNPQASFSEAFALYQSVEISFTKSDGGFLASAVRETSPQDIRLAANLAGIFTVNAFSQGTLQGSTFQENWASDGSRMTWIIGLPFTLHGISVNIRLPLEITRATQSVLKNGQTLPTLSDKKEGDIMPGSSMIPLGSLRVEFTLKENVLEVSRIIELE